MAGHQVDGALDEVTAAMAQLRRAMRGIPADQPGFRVHHDRAAKAIARLVVELEDARLTLPG